MIVRIGNSVSEVSGTDAELAQARKMFRTYAPGFRYTKLFKMKKWDGKTNLMNGNQIPTGLVPQLKKFNPQFIDERTIETPTFKRSTVPLRQYQWDSVKKSFETTFEGMWWPRGVLKIATGGGKTEIAAAMLQMTNVPSLFLVHRKELVDQAKARFEKYGVTGVKVMTIQSLMSFMHRTNRTANRTDEDVEEIRKRKAKRGKETIEWLKTIEQVFVDEAHLIAANLDKGNTFTQALRLMPNAYMRWGLTATAFMREEYHDWLLEGATGGLLCEIRNKELIEQGYLTPPKITMHRVTCKGTGDYALDYDYGIVINKARNNLIVDAVEREEGPTMVLVQRIEHGELLKKMCLEADIDVEFLYGNVPVPDRKAALQKLREGKLKAVIGSTIWDEGLDVAEIRTVILAGGGKSKIKNLQRVGRGLRLAEGKEQVHIIDFMDRGSKFLQRHAMQRKKIWHDEGFEVEVV